MMRALQTIRRVAALSAAILLGTASLALYEIANHREFYSTMECVDHHAHLYLPILIGNLLTFIPYSVMIPFAVIVIIKKSGVRNISSIIPVMDVWLFFLFIFICGIYHAVKSTGVFAAIPITDAVVVTCLSVVSMITGYRLIKDADRWAGFLVNLEVADKIVRLAKEKEDVKELRSQS